MNPVLLLILLAACGVLLTVERRQWPLTLSLTFKGDIKRESGWLAQYGQGLCTVVAALLVWRLDPRLRAAGGLLVAVFGASLIAYMVKRLAGRVRPNRENAGRFLGPTWKHDNSRESFPSSHSAAAVAMSVFLAALYPQAGVVFWGLAILCAVLRYIMDAHWPSDVFGGIALGYAAAHAAWRWCM